MSESGMRKRVVQALRPLHAIAVENPCLPGTPDVNYVEGWAELKWIRSWPRNPETIVRIDHYTKQQQVFAYQRRKAGGQCWFLLQCRREWLLLDGAVAALHVNKATREELISLSALYSEAGLPAEELVDLLRNPQPPFRLTAAEIARLRETS